MYMYMYMNMYIYIYIYIYICIYIYVYGPSMRSQYEFYAFYALGFICRNQGPLQMICRDADTHARPRLLPGAGRSCTVTVTRSRNIYFSDISWRNIIVWTTNPIPRSPSCLDHAKFSKPPCVLCVRSMRGGFMHRTHGTHGCAFYAFYAWWIYVYMRVCVCVCTCVYTHVCIHECMLSITRMFQVYKNMYVRIKAFTNIC